MNTRIALSSLRARTTTVAPYDFPMEVQYEYDEGEAPIFWPTELAHPGSPPNVQLVSCRIGGVEVYEMLSSGQIENIEEAVLRQLEN